LAVFVRLTEIFGDFVQLDLNSLRLCNLQTNKVKRRSSGINEETTKTNKPRPPKAVVSIASRP
jgi:hypothetical protein